VVRAELVKYRVNNQQMKSQQNLSHVKDHNRVEKIFHLAAIFVIRFFRQFSDYQFFMQFSPQSVAY